jgi:hypothetical protein
MTSPITTIWFKNMASALPNAIDQGMMQGAQICWNALMSFIFTHLLVVVMILVVV